LRRLAVFSIDATCGNLAAALERLRIGDIDECLRVNRLDEAVAERVGRRPERPDGFRALDALLDRRVDGAVVDE
jgi:hypothetical protein